MKNLLVFILAAIGIVACQNRSVDNKQTSPEISGDKKLLSDASGIFKPLPLVAETPENPLTREKVHLGKMLYYDNRLSKSGNNSCNSCHILSLYGVDNRATSIGDAGKNGERNSPTVLNAALHTAQFWDGRAKDVEEQAGMPILNPVEMAIPGKPDLEKRLRGIKEYKDAFAKAYPDEKNPVTYTNLQKAIGAFERTLITPSRFDDFLKGDLMALNEEEKTGLKVFMDAGCPACHNDDVIGGKMFQKFGLITNYMALTGSIKEDIGRAGVTKQEADKFVFKVPGLRNIEKTYPYFHDGSVDDLGKAVAIMGKAQLNKTFSEQEINSIVAFLNSLTGTIPADALPDSKEMVLK